MSLRELAKSHVDLVVFITVIALCHYKGNRVDEPIIVVLYITLSWLGARRMQDAGYRIQAGSYFKGLPRLRLCTSGV